ncbi:TRAP transporter small permease subunit [Lentilitoribacter sp. EG35]|uniref:TRAP transporter small permease subunit n=1 Tax=Lentilitoribacter sp. EG35 TaxID=3234192 RepID=UPI00346171E0
MEKLRTISLLVDRLNDWIGRTTAWLTLIMVLVQLTVVILRYVFSIGSISLQESIWYMHGTVFMVAAGAVFLADGHVRIDVFYRGKSEVYRAWVNLVGILALLLPVCFATIYLSWGYVTNSWATLEGSIELSGLPLIFLYKTMIWVFAGLLGLQACSEAIKCLLIIGGKTAEEV